ncbi:SRPBCC domain-containing protein [Aquimarina sp. TRL1]|uniref:SRPBCC domain-containing protein n=1 Tax=Aquimarina sp. (strain TRL1) TaxID=2736252 RepID=UPI0015898C2A|nr:SRPBCC domain-containing protein [Aquimarina sp. TRL1]QKX04842.1 SRPBCC domain-containing protein [Aquimarina sp. TRL1]
MDHSLKSERILTLRIDAKDLWKVLTESTYTKQYMFNCAVTSNWEAGDTIVWEGTYEGYEAFQKGKVIEIIPYEKIKYSTFDPNFGLEDIPKNYIHVSYLISSENDKTILKIINETFDGNYDRLHHINQGWEMVSDKIKKVVETL